MTTHSSGRDRDHQRDRVAGAYARWGKRALDLVIGSLALALAAPLLVIVALAVRATLGRPVLFLQRRVGQGGREFTCIKFRTMHPDRRQQDQGTAAGLERRVTHKSAADPRLTWLGRLLRMTSVDELPQLVNVLRGEMSLVGPRPELPSVVARYAPWQHRRHDVKPGMTGLWQVTARADTAMHEATEIDLDYLDRVSLKTDLAILARTIPALLTQRGM